MPKATVMAMALLPTMLLAAHLDARVTAAQTFVATASVQNSCGSLNHSTGDHLSLSLDPDDEREKAIAALKQGEAALKTAMDAMPEIGTIQLGGRTTPVRFARSLDIVDDCGTEAVRLTAIATK